MWYYNPWFVVFVLGGISIPIIGSFAICVPKWWDKVIEPHLPDFFDGIPGPQGTEWWLFPIRLIGSLVFFVIATVVLGVLKYWHCMASLIERKCPYTSPDRGDDYDSAQGEASRFSGTYINMLIGVWDFTLGRR